MYPNEFKRSRTFSTAEGEIVELEYAHIWQMVKIDPVANFSAMVVNRRQVGDMTFVAIGGLRSAESGGEPYLFEVPEKTLDTNFRRHLLAALHKNLGPHNFVYKGRIVALGIHLRQQAEEIKSRIEKFSRDSVSA